MLNKISIITFFLSIIFFDVVYASNIQYSGLKTGDIIFRKENSFLSNRFEKLDGRGFSHIGIIYFVKKKICVIHIERNSEKNDFKIVLLDLFLQDATRYKIKRLKNTYNLESIKTNIEKIIKHNPKFDFDFDLSTDEKLYCSELIYKLYKKSFDIELTSERKTFGYYNYISVGSIFNSEYLKDITTLQTEN